MSTKPSSNVKTTVVRVGRTVQSELHSIQEQLKELKTQINEVSEGMSEDKVMSIVEEMVANQMKEFRGQFISKAHKDIKQKKHQPPPFSHPSELLVNETAMGELDRYVWKETDQEATIKHLSN